MRPHRPLAHPDNSLPTASGATGMSLTPSVEVGLRRDGGDAQTGAGMDVGGGLAFIDTDTGLSLVVRLRTPPVHQADGFRERGSRCRSGGTRRPSSPLGLTARVAPSWGGQGGAGQALWSSQMAYGDGLAAGGRRPATASTRRWLRAAGGRALRGTPRIAIATSQYGRDLRFGYGLGGWSRAA